MKSPYTKNTLLKNAQANPASNFLREYFFRHPRRNSIFFLPPFGVLIFFATAQQPTTDKHLDRTTQETNQQHLDADEEARTGNSGFKKLAVQWLIAHSTSHQLLWWLDSFVLRNRQLLKPTNRYKQGYDDHPNNEKQTADKRQKPTQTSIGLSDRPIIDLLKSKLTWR